ncbi:MAG: uracil phosphoribosyltransferase [Planctomycetes bacterium]|jgi:uracil phosphoribosyltransferase|nr:uracil phosphoribosyltransferase [Planctomycetota bacterium]MBT4027802.1 uracil phosphoribosyltransferase [Planctomycetota bacterium]MBT4560403.1 uracil phosphoribosyltransferase [Planctomycetota bacterium]MBT7318754.1 uracil phosphoribosyltransferase [Planctomycetota bacterium]
MNTLTLSTHPIVADRLTRLRDVNTTPEQFRGHVHALTLILASEATQALSLQDSQVETPLQAHTGSALQEHITLVPILRAGLGMVSALHLLIPQADVRHLGFYRDEEKLEPVAYYEKLPKGQASDCCLVLDPMLATGGSAIAAIDTLKEWGCPRILFLGILGAPEGARALERAHPDVAIHLCGIDERLNEVGYILPGLGDAGDRLFAT